MTVLDAVFWALMIGLVGVVVTALAVNFALWATEIIERWRQQRRAP